MHSPLNRARTAIMLSAALTALILSPRLSADSTPHPTGTATGTLTLEIVSAVSHPSAGAAVGVIYLHIVNHTEQSDRLIAVETAAAAKAEFHETVAAGDIVRMTPRPEGFEIPKAGQLVLESGGKHIMLMGLAEPLESGGAIELELVFEHAERMRVRVPIRPRSF